MGVGKTTITQNLGGLPTLYTRSQCSPLRPLPDKDSSYELIAGERRYRAALAAGLKEVPVTICSLSDEQALQISLVENLLREDLNPVEEIEGILQLLALRLNVAREEVTSVLHRMRDEQRGKVQLKKSN